jgi:hypothetical protein
MVMPKVVAVLQPILQNILLLSRHEVVEQSNANVFLACYAGKFNMRVSERPSKE